jgi:hypothetical protein
LTAISGDSTKFIKVTPVCPASGTYAVTAIGTTPTCTISGHTL